MILPLFPLSSHVLPGGRMALRIFEARYVRMIKEACANDTGFVICMLNSQGDTSNNSHIFDTGTHCKIIDFDLLEDGLLGITVEGKACVSIMNITTQTDGLRVADCRLVKPWVCNISIDEIHPIDSRLQEIFQKYPEISSLYDELKFDDPLWVINRWIELLPVGAKQKQYFLTQPDCQQVISYLNDLIE